MRVDRRVAHLKHMDAVCDLLYHIKYQVRTKLTEYKTTGQKQSRGSTNNIVAAAVAAFEKRLK